MLIRNIVILLLITFNCVAETINVKDYGAKGDGVTNDYPALKKVVDKINNNGGGTLYFPPGKYYIGEFHDGTNTITDLEFKNCNNLKIYGLNAVISLKGNFNRPVTRRTTKHVFSNVGAIIPIKIIQCTNVVVENLEINGNLDQMTRDKDVMETGGHLVSISESKGVTLKNLYLHHAQTDGLVIRGTNKPSFDVKADHIVSANNARQGLTIGYLVGGEFTNCKFINTGLTGGKYGSHAPAAGLDIEPNKNTDIVSDVKFVDCLFERNLGSQFTCSSPETIKNISFTNCKFIASEQSYRYTIIVSAKNVLFEDSYIDCIDGSVYPTWQKEGSSSIFKNCYIASRTSAIVAVNGLNGNSVIIDSCTLEYTGTKKLNSYFPYIRMNGLSFINNKIKIPKDLLRDKGPSSLIQNVRKATNNQFYNGDTITDKPSVSYSGAKEIN
ncbi:MAG: glycosyl hydrolase family 28-related protein [Bacteroidota bacterium]